MSVRITGMRELEKKLQKLSKQLGPDKVEPVLFSAAEVVTEAIRARAPQGPTGNLKRAIITKQLSRQGNEPAPSIAAVDRRIASHAGFIEFGTSKMPAQPFFRRGWNAKRKQALGDIEDALKNLIDEVT